MERILVTKGTIIKYTNGYKYYEVLEDTIITDAQDTLYIIGLPEKSKRYHIKAKNAMVVKTGKLLLNLWERKTKKPFDVKNVIFNPPATIVYFNDGTKEIVKVAEGEVYDYSTGVHLCVMKRLLGKEQYQKSKKYLFKEMKESQRKYFNNLQKRKRPIRKTPKHKPKFKVGDIIECIKPTPDTWQGKGDIRVVKKLGERFFGGISYRVDTGAGINYKNQKNWKKIGEVTK